MEKPNNKTQDKIINYTTKHIILHNKIIKLKIITLMDKILHKKTK